MIQDPGPRALPDALHARSDGQAPELRRFHNREAGAQTPTADELKAFRSDRLVALDRDKAEFCHQLCRASNARRVVDAATSHGVSMPYLAAAVRDNIRASSGDGRVIGTQYEPEKARIARRSFARSGLERFIDLREGDLRDTLRQIDGPVDFMLVDIWTPMAPRAGVGVPAPSVRRDGRLRQHRGTAKRLRGVFRIPRRSGARLPDNHPALRRRPELSVRCDA